MTSFETTVQGFRVVGLRNETVELAVMPELGAKVSSLIQRETGREWMWTPPQGAYFRRLPIGTPFDQSSIVGADECIPTIAPCHWRGRNLPDHGEAWSEEWTLDEAAFAQGAIVTSLRFPISPLWLERRITVQDNTVRFAYTLRNESNEPCEFMWAFHPLFIIVEGDRILLPAGATVRTDSAMNCPLGRRGDHWHWPDPLPGIHLDRLDLGGPNRAVKLFTDPLTTGSAVIHNERTGEKLTYTFVVNQIDTVGIWLNRGAWNGYEHLAIEPGIGAPDPLDLAVTDWQRYGALAPNGTHQWWFEIALSVEE